MAQKEKAPGSSQSVGAILRRDLPPALKLALKLAEIQQLWPNLAGPALAALSRPVSLDRSGLVVVCQSPAAAQRLQMGAGPLLRRISRRWALDLPGIRPVVAPLENRRDRAPEELLPREIYPRPEDVEGCYEKIRTQIDREDTALALARLEALYRRRFGEGSKGSNKRA